MRYSTLQGMGQIRPFHFWFGGEMVEHFFAASSSFIAFF